MDMYTATEQAYKNGYAKGYEEGKKNAVVHAKWEYYQMPSGIYGIRCTHCKGHNGLMRKFCPECGAVMDK